MIMKTQICSGTFGCGQRFPLSTEYFATYPNGAFDKTCRSCRNKYANTYNKGITSTPTVYPTILLKGKSHSERIDLVAKWLIENDIAYERDKVFDDCPKDPEGNDVVFDFWLPELNTIIEVDELNSTEEIQILISPN